MIGLLLLQLLPGASFQDHVRDACSRLQIVQAPVEVSSAKGWAAWVQNGPGAEWKVFVRPDFLRDADPLAQRSVAYHETCHLYLGNNRRNFVEGEEGLVHFMIAGCVQWLHGPQFHWAMLQMPCQHWYPSEAARYNRLIGKEHCFAKR